MIALGAVAVALTSLMPAHGAATERDLQPAVLTPGALRRLLEAPGALRVGARELDAAALRRFYRARRWAPAWGPDASGIERAGQARQALDRASEHGLDTRLYQTEAMGAQPSAMGRELLLTDAVLRYARHVRTGRISPREIEHDWDMDVPRFDAVAGLARALAAGALDRWLADLQPPHPDYGSLVQALRRYREIDASGGWPSIGPGRPIRPGDVDERVPALSRRLVAEGDLPEAEAARGARYDDGLEAAVRRFQARHGLVVDGIVGPRTRAALGVTPRQRIHQLALSLERWRWLPRDLGARYALVNSADAMLTLWEEGREVLVSRVVVGDREHPTPVVGARVDALVFNPSWTIPTSIAVEEMLPRLRANPRYLADNGIVILDRPGADPSGLGVDWAGIAPEAFPFRLRQRPGPENPLGRIRFETPNRFDVFLHDSPARALFTRPLRVGSHGCVRVERALALATRLLAGEAGWDAPAVERAVATGRTRRVALRQPFPVYLLYFTAFVDPDGAVHFRPDVYGRDERLEAALERVGHALD